MSMIRLFLPVVGLLVLFIDTATAQYNNHLVVLDDTLLSLGNGDRQLVAARYKTQRLVNVISNCKGNIDYTLYSTKYIFKNDSALFDSMPYKSNSSVDKHWIAPLEKSNKLVMVGLNNFLNNIYFKIVDIQTNISSTRILVSGKKPDTILSNNIALFKKNESDSLWILLRPFLGDFKCFLVDSSGLKDSSEFKTSVTAPSGNFPNFFNQISINHAGNTIAAVGFNNGNTNIYLYDFNMTSGQLSNERALFSNTTFAKNFDLEDLIFSPNDSFIYFTAYTHNELNPNKDISFLYQAKIYGKQFSNKPMRIYSVIIEEYQNGVPKYPLPLSFMEGSDQKIYTSGDHDSVLGVIESPNNLGLRCKYIPILYKFNKNKSSYFNPQIWSPYHPAFIDIETTCGDTATLTYTGDTVYNEMTFYWGDGDSSYFKRGQYWHGMHLKHYYTKRDTVYPVKLAIPVNDCGYRSWRVDSARVVTPPRSAGLQWKQTTECKTNTLELSDSVSYVNKVLITWGDGENGLELLQKPGPYQQTHTYKKGKYDLKIEVSNDYCTHTFDTTFEAGVLPEIESVLYDSMRTLPLREPQGAGLCAGQQLVLSDTFKNLKTRTIFWGDGTSDGTLRLSKGDSTAIFQHMYSDSGFFTITLFDTSTSDCPFQDSFKVYVRPKPEWKYPLKDTIFCDQFFLTLKTGTQYSDDETYNWNDLTNQLGIGTDSILFWLKTGLLEASVTNVCGTQRDTISIKRLEKPVIKLDSLYDACENLSLKLAIGNSKNEESYLWSTTETTPTITTTKAGNYWAKAMNYCGMDSVYFKVVLYPKPNPNFIVSDVCEGELVNFQNKTIGGKTYEWRFGDGTISTDSIPNKTYAITQNSRTYFVTLVAKISKGCQDSISKPLNVNATSEAGFTHTSQGKTVFFTQTATEPGESYKWFFGDGDSSTQTNPSHQYTADSGTYNVCLNILNAANCHSRVCRLVHFDVGIDPLEKAIFSVFPNPTEGVIHIKFDKAGKYQVFILDVLGRPIHTSQTAHLSHLILLPETAKGSYLIKVVDEKGVSGQMVVIVW